MKLNEIPKYTTIETVMQLTRRQRAILYKQCVNGRSCYIDDVNYNTGGFFQDCFDYRGVFVGPFLTYKYIREEKENKFIVLEIIKEKPYGITHVRTYKTYEEYMQSCFRQYNPLTKEEFDLLKEVLS